MKPFRMVLSVVLVSLSTLAFAQTQAPGSVAVTIAPASVHSGDPQNTLQSRLESLRRNAMAAWQRKDGSALIGIMASDFMFVSPSGAASREQWLGALPHCSIGNYTMDQVQLHPISTDSASLVYKLHYVGECDGKPSPSDAMAVDTFSRREGRWWIVNTSFMPQQQ